MNYKNILGTIGNTPLVKITKLNTRKNTEVFAKVEGANPGGSIKDRVALSMIEAAEKSGKLTKDKIIIEPSSGNTGIGIAMVGVVKGYKVVIAMSKAVSVERRRMIKAFGADVILTNKDEGTDGAIRKVHALMKKNPDKYYFPNQFSNPYNPRAHANTAAEICKQMQGRIDYMVAAIGTSGTLMGLSTYLKKKDPKIKIISAEPTRGHTLQGMKNMDDAITPKIFKPEMLDERITVRDQDALDMTKQIIKKEGIFVGMSSGAALWVALQIATRTARSDKRIVVIFPDRGEKYLSTRLFAD